MNWNWFWVRTHVLFSVLATTPLFSSRCWTLTHWMAAKWLKQQHILLRIQLVSKKGTWRLIVFRALSGPVSLFQLTKTKQKHEVTPQSADPLPSRSKARPRPSVSPSHFTSCAPPPFFFFLPHSIQSPLNGCCSCKCVCSSSVTLVSLSHLPLPLLGFVLFFLLAESTKN